LDTKHQICSGEASYSEIKSLRLYLVLNEIIPRDLMQNFFQPTANNKAVILGLFFLILACGLSCSKSESPQISFDHAYKTFLHGDLKVSQDEAHLECQRFRGSSPEWAWKFRILEAESLMLRGMSQDALTLLTSQSMPPTARDSVVEILAIEGIVYARKHSFLEAERVLGQAEQLCSGTGDSICGSVIRAQGVVAIEHGDLALSRKLFESTLSFARAHDDKFLESTALLNLGASSLREEHFDEAVDWTEAALKTSTAVDAGSIATKALGNLGWAYYNLGDLETSLQLTEQAEKRSIELANVIDQLSYLNNAGRLYADLRDVPRAKQSYLQSLTLAMKIDSKEDTYNALRALALVSVKSGELDDARKYSDDAIAIARADKNRLDELYPLLVKGMIAARSHDGAGAERVFIEVEQDQSCSASLKWQAEHGLAQLYEDENRPNDADHEYRAALATFEAARSSLRRNDSKLPFSSNASSIYDDYIHFLVARGKPDAALRWADYSRARTLAEGLGLLAKGSSTGPLQLNPQQIAQRAEGTVFYYWLGEKQSYLWVIRPQTTDIFTLPSASEIDAAVLRYRKSLLGPLDVLETANTDGIALYRMLVAPANKTQTKDARVFIIPDGSLNNLNFETLLAPEPHLHYWIDDVSIANASSLRLLAASQRGTSNGTGSLLLFGDAIAPNKDYNSLPKAAVEMEIIEKHFPPKLRHVFARDQATPAIYLASNPEQFSYIHFVAHGIASRLSPLESAIVLSKATAEENSFKLYAREIVHHTLHAELVTISTCNGAGTRAYAGEGMVGLSWAFLRAGAHNVIGALWDVSDDSTPLLMNELYSELKKGKRPDAALHTAKLSLLHSNAAFRKPFYWAPFQLYTGSNSVKNFGSSENPDKLQ
jgi:CHAT domain-containing protein/tetratricopeptide (TPR) repeat protein